MNEFSKRYLKKQRDFSADYKPHFPRIIKIDICNVCNQACVFCPQSKQINKKGCIDSDLCRKIIQDAYFAGAREMGLSSTGEPLLNKKLPEYIRLAKELGYEYIFINTNGLLMDEDMSENILKEGIDSVKFSINASQKSYSLVHGTDSYFQVIRNLEKFYQKREILNKNCKIYVSYIATKFTLGEINQVKKDIEAYIDDFVVMNANNRGGLANEVVDELYVEDDEYSLKYPCSQIFNNVYVTAEGYMTVCCQDFENNMVVADLNLMSVEDAWNCADFIEFRKRFLNKDIKGILCDNCLNNTHKPIVPLNSKYAGYVNSKIKVNDLQKRIGEMKSIFAHEKSKYR